MISIHIHQLQGIDYYRWIIDNEPEWADFR
jgi:hypothetical protein